ncbi:MAG: glycosyltransferase family 9 protein [Gilliamella sp.]|uniref:glycosyltransferase family 9 protein n=1 Tax=Gilliamella sp. TaxID=1891236 RepID=UPI0025EA762A|nr:glycosyltransferase family 9 protein [Gilliamella sp.]MCO6551218.1 glycosyltransferase family 9 protein [Gilliamella sp.]
MSHFSWQLKFIRKKIKLHFFYFLNKILMCFFPKRKTIFEPSKIKTILIARNDKIGDMVVTTALIKNLAQAGYDVYVSSQQSSLDILKNNPNVRATFSYNDYSLKDLFKTIQKIRKHHFDLVIDTRPFYSFEMRKIIFCAFTNSTHLMGFNKSNVKSYNISIPYYNNNAHITNQLNKIYEYMNIKNYDESYDLYTLDNNKKNVDNFILENNIGKFVIINPFGGARKRELSQWQMEYIVSLMKKNKPDHKIVFIGEPNKLKNVKLDLGLIFQSNTILDVVALIKKAEYVITVDTSIVHIIAAFNKPCLTIYSESNLFEQTDDFNLIMRKQWKDYYRQTCNNLVDNSYLKKNNLLVEIPYCYDQIWSPNNPSAKQIVFYKTFLAKVDNDEFSRCISPYLG